MKCPQIDPSRMLKKTFAYRKVKKIILKIHKIQRFEKKIINFRKMRKTFYLLFLLNYVQHI
jgi:hypothetical protein